MASLHSSLIPAVTRLEVAAFGRSWVLLPVFEPLWHSDGRLAALELLSRLQDSRTGEAYPPEPFFAQAPWPELQRIFQWQLDVLAMLIPWCQSRQTAVSLNLSRPVARTLLSDPDTLQVCQSLSPWLRLEISEHFLMADQAPSRDPVLSTLKSAAPLWLDDFGCGSATLTCLQSGLFEAIKLDKSLCGLLVQTPEGLNFLKAVSALARESGVQLIVEGVEDDGVWQRVKNSGVTAFQGWRWPAVLLAELNALPVQLPPPDGDSNRDNASQNRELS